MDDPFSKPDNHYLPPDDWTSNPQFLEDLKRRNEAAWLWFYRHTFPLVYSALYKQKIENQEDAKDLAQLALTNATQSIGGFNFTEHGTLTRWVITIASNAATDWLRQGRAKKRGAGQVPRSLDEPSGLDDDSSLADTVAAPASDGHVDAEAIVMALNKLWVVRPKCAEVVELVIFRGMQFKEAAARLKITEAAAKGRYFDCALPRLAQFLREIISPGNRRK
jgi:RNA polymerase sigma factor (sigma-70 family)